MDLLEALVEVVKALAWPLAVLVLARMFKEPLIGLIELVESVRYKDAELKIAKRIEQTKELQQKATPSSPASTPRVTDSLANTEAEILDVLSLSPHAAILLSWRALEMAGQNAVSRLAVSGLPPQLRSPFAFAEVLWRESKISPEEMKIISNLRKIRNDIAHMGDSKITEESALDYAMMALAIARRLGTP